MPAPKDNRNAAKEDKGIQVNFYLGANEVRAIREQSGAETDQEVRAYARELAKNGIDLGIQGLQNLCSVEGCYWVASITCNLGKCAPSTKWCEYHYAQAHLPEDERDKNKESERP